MGIMEFWPKKKGNVEEGGTTRAAGEAEPEVLKAKGLSEAEIAMRPETEAYEQAEKKAIIKFLKEGGLSPVDVYKNSNVYELLMKKNPGMRYNMIDKHLAEMIAEMRKEPKRPNA